MISYRINKFYLFVVLSLGFIAISGLAHSQNANNPFEIKNRINKESVLQTPDSLNQDTVNILIPATERPKAQKEDHSTWDDSKTNNTNPFEVDHIPLRKKDVLSDQIKEHQEAVKNNESPSRSFIYWSILVGLILLTLATSSNRKLFGKIVKAIFNENILKQEFRGGASLTLEYILLYLVYFINGGIFLLLVWNYFFQGEINLTNFGWCSVLLVGIYLVRHISMNILGMIFPVDKEAKLYSFTIQLFNAFIGICLIPVNLFLAFGPESITKMVLFIGFGLICILFIVRVVRGLAISLSFIFNRIILFFVYLCTLEIAPMLVLVKLIEKIN